MNSLTIFWSEGVSFTESLLWIGSAIAFKSRFDYLIHILTVKHLFDTVKKMANIIELSNQAYEARDQAQMEIAAIQQADAKETQEYDEQMQALGRKIEEDKKRKDVAAKQLAAAEAALAESSSMITGGERDPDLIF